MRPQNILLIAAVIGSLAPATPAAARDRLIDLERSTVTVRVFTSGQLLASGDNIVIEAPLSEGTFDPAKRHVSILIDTRRMRVVDPRLAAKDRDEVQARMLGPDVLDVKRFDRIHFHSITTDRLGADAWLVKGELELRGQIRGMDVKVSPQNGRYKGSAAVRQTDYGIVPISIAGGTVKVKDEITVEFDIVVTDRLATVAPGGAYSAYSGIKAKVHIEPPDGTLFPP